MRLVRRGLLVAAGLISAGCGHGRVGPVVPLEPASDPAWTYVAGVPFVRQEAEMECGAAVLAMALGKGGRPTSVADISSVIPPTQDHGMAATQMRDVARREGFEAYLLSGTLDDLRTELERGHPIVVGLVKVVKEKRFSHYELVVGLRRDGAQIITLDPASGPRQQSATTFLAEWSGSSRAALVVWRGH